MTRTLSKAVLSRLLAFGAVFAMTVFVIGCAQTTQVPMTNNHVSSILPTANGHSIVDIPTPSFNGNSISAGTTSGHMVCLTWQSNSPDNTTFDYSTGLDPVAGNLNGTYGWEYWGCTQKSIVITNNGGQPAYSGHYELTRLNPDNTTTNLGDITADSYCDDNLADGTYTYYLKAKSLEGSTPNQMTHHSDISEGYSVTVTSCTDDGSGTVHSITGYIALGTGNWNSTIGTAGWSSTNLGATWSDPALWTKTAGGNGYNIGFTVNTLNWVHNTCTGYTNTPVTGGYTGTLYCTINGGTTWFQPVQYSILHPYYEINGSPSHGWGPPISNHTYVVVYSTTNNMSGALGSFTVHTN